MTPLALDMVENVLRDSILPGLKAGVVFKHDRGSLDSDGKEISKKGHALPLRSVLIRKLAANVLEVLEVRVAVVGVCLCLSMNVRYGL